MSAGLRRNPNASAAGAAARSFDVPTGSFDVLRYTTAPKGSFDALGSCAALGRGPAATGPNARATPINGAGAVSASGILVKADASVGWE